MGGGAEAEPLGIRIMHRKPPFTHRCYHTEFGRSRSDHRYRFDSEIHDAYVHYRVTRRRCI